MSRLQGEDLLTRYKRALEGLTAGGSEFVDDPERCADTVQRSLDARMKMLISLSKIVKELRRKLQVKEAA